MIKFKQIIAGSSLFAVAGLAAASAALAHDASSTEAGHTYANNETCAGGAGETTDNAYPSSGIAADCGVAVASDSAALAATAHVLANCSITAIENLTNDVIAGGTPLAAVTAFDFPTQTTGGPETVESDSFDVAVSCDSDWQLTAAIDGDFSKVGEAGTLKTADTFGVAGEAFTGAADTVDLGSYEFPVQNSDAFEFSSAPGAPEAGDYTGSFTLTVNAI